MKSALFRLGHGVSKRGRFVSSMMFNHQTPALQMFGQFFFLSCLLFLFLLYGTVWKWAMVTIWIFPLAVFLFSCFGSWREAGGKIFLGCWMIQEMAALTDFSLGM